ncbi:MAG: TIGR01459 family HAD-type hydrolase [Hyphomicrobiales bacterium]
MTVETAIPVVSSLKDIGSRYRAWLVDIWGVMHNGRVSFSNAAAATRSFREQGGIVVLLSNSPRPSPAVKEQLRHFGVPDDAYDATVTSGDLTRHEIGKHEGARVFHLGPERDRPIFTDLDVALVEPDEAEIVVCSGLFDDVTQTPADYTDLLATLAERDLPMICANPDHLVERGHELVYCAGALAAVYEEKGGEVIYAGKPYAPVYELALETISGLAGRKVEKAEVLAIGDGVNTDIAGASDFGVDAVFVASGLHAPGEGGEALDARHLAELFADRPRRPIAATSALVW